MNGHSQTLSQPHTADRPLTRRLGLILRFAHQPRWSDIGIVATKLWMTDIVEGTLYIAWAGCFWISSSEKGSSQ
jgi:hypothetical protein